jgi:hypothetical protein
MFRSFLSLSAAPQYPFIMRFSVPGAVLDATPSNPFLRGTLLQLLFEEPAVCALQTRDAVSEIFPCWVNRLMADDQQLECYLITSAWTVLILWLYVFIPAWRTVDKCQRGPRHESHNHLLVYMPLKWPLIVLGFWPLTLYAPQSERCGANYWIGLMHDRNVWVDQLVSWAERVFKMLTYVDIIDTLMWMDRFYLNLRTLQNTQKLCKSPIYK